MSCSERCEPNGHSYALQQQQHQQQHHLQAGQRLRQAIYDFGNKDEHSRVGMCFVTERPEGLSIDCNVPMPNSFSFDAFSSAPIRTNNNTLLNHLPPQPPSSIGCASPSPNADTQTNSFLAFNAAISNFAAAAPSANFQQASSDCDFMQPQSKSFKQSIPTKPTCACLPVQHLMLTQQQQKPPVKQSLPTPLMQQSQNCCNYMMQLTAQQQHEQQQEQPLAVDGTCILNGRFLNQPQATIPQHQQQSEFQQQTSCSCKFPVARQEQQQQQFVGQHGMLKPNDDHGLVRFESPCFLADCNCISLPLQPVQQQQHFRMQQQQRHMHDAVQQQYLMQQQQQPFSQSPLRQQNHQQQPRFPTTSLSSSSVLDLNNNNSSNVVNNNNIYQHQPQHQFQSPPQQQQQSQQQPSSQQQATNSQQINTKNTSCWCQGDCTCHNSNSNTDCLAIGANNSTSGNPICTYTPTCTSSIKPTAGCSACNCWHFPRYSNWCWHSHPSFLQRASVDSNSCKNIACSPRR